MLPCLVNFRSPLRHASQLGGLFPFSPYITSLLPYFLFPSSSDEKPVTATPLHSVLSPYCFKSFSCNTYWPPRKCCKQKTYGLAKPFRCNTYKNQEGVLSAPLPRRSHFAIEGPPQFRSGTSRPGRDVPTLPIRQASTHLRAIIGPAASASGKKASQE